MQRKLLSIQVISDLQPIPNADRIEHATILGWKVVVGKGEFVVGDKCLYFEIDSRLPQTPFFEKFKDVKYLVKTIVIRGVLSQGLAFPMSALDHMTDKPVPSLIVGQDLTDLVGIEKYEIVLEASTEKGIIGGDFPSHIVPHTDIIRIQSKPELLQEMYGKHYYATQKIDGMSATYIYSASRDTYYSCSKDYTIKAIPRERHGNAVLLTSERLKMEERLRDYHAVTRRSLALQGEIAGLGIRKNRMGLSEHDFFVFNIYDTDNDKYVGYNDLQLICNDLKLKTVPLLEIGIFTHTTIDSLLELANQNQYPNGHPQEGIVITPTEEVWSNALMGRLIFKVINNNYLLKTKE